ncbi:MAG: response regulator [Spirochaetes bacterium]|nr:response regulator [Spirochaetota bacterium]
MDNSLKILLVDDSDVHLMIAENILKEKYNVTTAKSGKDALALLSKGGLVPNLILLDVLMPDMDGWEVYNKIKGISLLQNVSVAFLTSLDGEKEKLYASRLGAADLITKPYESGELLKRVETILAKGKTA